MKTVRRSGTEMELLLQETLTALGLEYKVNIRPITSLNLEADLFFPRAHVAIFIDSCF